jgi:hypothetical protein
MDTIELKAQEYGIRVYEVLEYSTSNHCAIHGTKVARDPRGVVTCPLGHKLHSDLNGALNILRRGAGSMPATLEMPLSFLVGHSGVAPSRGRNRRDPAPGIPGEPPPFRAGRGSEALLIWHRWLRGAEATPRALGLGLKKFIRDRADIGLHAVFRGA